MRTSRSRVAGTAALLAAAAALVLSGCTSAQAPTAPGPDATPDIAASQAPAGVSDEDLGGALKELIYAGEVPSDIGEIEACVVYVARGADFSPDALPHVSELRSDDWGAAARSLQEAGLDADADLLTSPEFRGDLEECLQIPAVDAALYDAPAASLTPYEEATPNRKARYEVESLSLTNSESLAQGLASILGSYAQTEADRELIGAASACIGNVVNAQDYSEESRAFFVGGAPLGGGDITAELATDEDREIWRSSLFVASVEDCITDAEQGGTDEVEAG